MPPLPPRTVILSLIVLLCTAATGAEPQVTVTQHDNLMRVTLGDKHFTDYVMTGRAKPILYPIHGPHQLTMTRNYPMVPKVAGEATDHPHHESLWFTHESVNGLSFWHLGGDRGRIVHDELVDFSSGDVGSITTRNRWVGPDDRVHLTDTTTLSFSGDDKARIIDYEVTLHASHGDVVFGDAKDGLIGIRMHPNLRLRQDAKINPGVPPANAVNSEGVSGVDVWGKRAKWIAYWAPIEGHMITIAIFDHPKNLRYPTWWHARDYGLVSANPFGISHFEKGQPKNSGAFTLRDGENLTFRYRFVFYDGQADAKTLDRLFDDFAGTTKIAPTPHARHAD